MQNGVALLLSGGMDSAALAFWKRPTIALTVDYGQSGAVGEIRAATAIADALSIEHMILTANCSELGSGDLAGKAPLEAAPASEWWPFRNQLLLTLGGMKAVTLAVKILQFGSVATDEFHQDGRPEFFDLINRVFRFQEGQLSVEAPAVHLTTAQLILESGIPRSVLAWSHSCHVSEFACGQCRGCFKFLSVMEELGYD